MNVSSHGQWSMVSSMIDVYVCMCGRRGGGSAVFSLLFVYPEFSNTKLLAI